jgi:hypothetical protein
MGQLPRSGLHGCDEEAEKSSRAYSVVVRMNVPDQRQRFSRLVGMRERWSVPKAKGMYWSRRDAKWTDPISPKRPLLAELTQMMICVQIPPVLPLRIGQTTEYRVGLQIGTCALSELFD